MSMSLDGYIADPDDFRSVLSAMVAGLTRLVASGAY